MLQKKSWRNTLAMTYAAIGVVYGDVGTSPLYVFSSTFTEKIPTETDVLGAMSIIFWTITLVVVVKYMLIILMADDNGEGGLSAPTPRHVHAGGRSSAKCPQRLVKAAVGLMDMLAASVIIGPCRHTCHSVPSQAHTGF